MTFHAKHFYTVSKTFLVGLILVQAATSNAFDLKKIKSDLQKKQHSKTEAAATLDPSSTCDAQASAGICYAFSGKKHTDDMNAAKANNAKKSAKTDKNSFLGVNDMACRMLRGSFSESAQCSTAKALGRCVVKKGTPEEYNLFYYQGSKFNKAKAEKDCENSKSAFHAQAAGVWKKI